MRVDILRFISLCQSCQQVNKDLTPRQGAMVPLPIPDRPWSTIGIDFIVKLPNSGGFDSVMVVVDHYSKYCHFIKAKETWSSLDLANAFVDQIFRLHGLPDKIVSDRGSVFMSSFWKSVTRLLCMNSAPSTAFHPQTDGQVERLNAVLEDYLRHFVCEKQDDWSRWLPLAEFANNNSISNSTGFSPFFACAGFHPRCNSLTLASKVPKADEFIGHMQNIQSKLERFLQAAKDRQSHYYDKDKRVDVVYQPGDLVWLSRKFIKTRRPSQKLDYRRIGPFPVVRMVGKNAVELTLSSEYARIHPVFNVALVMPVSKEEATPESEIRHGTLSNYKEGFSIARWLSVEVILDHRIVANQHEYLLRTEPTGINDAWVSIQYISRGLDEFIQAFHEMHTDRIRPSWRVFEDLSRPDVGYLAHA